MTSIPPKPRRQGGHIERRVAGTPPSIGRVGRLVPGTGRSRRGRKSRRSTARGDGAEGRTGTSVLTRWLILLLGLAGCTLVGIVLWTLVNQKDPGETAADLATGAGAGPARPSSQQAIELAQRMLDDPSPDNLALLIRPGALDPAEASRFIATHRESEKLDVQDPVWLGSAPSFGAPIEVVALATSGPVPRFVLLTPDREGRWRIDFDAFARHCTPPLQEFTDGAGEQALVRVFLTREYYYNGVFDEESEWDCYLLRSPDADRFLYGYCPRESIQAEALRKIHERAQTLARDQIELLGSPAGQAGGGDGAYSRVILKLSRPEGAAIQQYRIDSVLSDEWVLGEEPLDERMAAAEPGE